MRSHLAVDRVREIEWRRALWQVDDIPFRGKDEYFVGEEIDLDGIDELVWIGDIALPLEQLPQPGELGVVRIALMPLLVLPMGSDPELRILMHFGRSYLHFHPLAVGANHGCV